MSPLKRYPADRIILDPSGAEICQRIVSFEKLGDGTWDITEQCDNYFGANFTNEEVKALAQHLLKLTEDGR